MTDLTNILGGPWRPPPPTPEPPPPEHQLEDAMLAAGIVTPPDAIHLDGQLHRFRSGTKGKPGEDRSGWYVAFADGVPAGRFGCWRAGIEQSWRADVGREISTADQMAITRRLAEAQRARDAERRRSAELAAGVVDTIWSQAPAADDAHPYLARKGVGAHGARVTGDGRLVLPIYSPDGELASAQYIDHEGGKLYHGRGAVKGGMWWVGPAPESPTETVYLAEGFATAASIYAATGARCYIAYSAANLPLVCGTVRESHEDVVIVADNDGHGVGETKAREAAAAHGARVVVCPVQGDANDYVQAGHDLAALLALSKPVDNDEEWLMSADDFSTQQQPIDWLVQHWIQRHALIMVHGPSGGGKTFVVMDMALRMASRSNGEHTVKQWLGGETVEPGAVVYLAGEGHQGMRSRIAAWKQHHGVQRLDAWVSKSGCDLNTPDGLRQVIGAIKRLDRDVDLVIVDTLHRFLVGDENSAQDAKTMLDACAEIMDEFKCSVLLVHHTGVSEEAQHRARGSSAWRGALDIEMSVTPRGDGKISIVQKKSKDAELAKPLWAELDKVKIDGWEDKDGQPVTSAVLVGADGPVKDEVSASVAKWKQQIQAAWLASGREMHEGKPYVSRQAIMDYLMKSTKDKKGNNLSESNARKAISPSDKQRMVGGLVNEKLIESAKDGYVVVCNNLLSGMKVAGSLDGTVGQ